MLRCLNNSVRRYREGIKAPGPLRRGSRGLPHWASCSEGKKGRGQGKRESQKVKTFREEEEETAWVLETTPE